MAHGCEIMSWKVVFLTATLNLQASGHIHGARAFSIGLQTTDVKWAALHRGVVYSVSFSVV